MSKQILSLEFESLKLDLIKAYDSKGMRASGKWADSLEVEAEKDSAILWGEDYSQQLETGRAAGGLTPIEKIEQWIIDKSLASQIDRKVSKSGVVQTIEQAITSFAWGIATSHKEKGWKREDHGGVELISEEVTNDRFQLIIDEVGIVKIVELSTEITGLIEELAV
jgi:hypothetical protein